MAKSLFFHLKQMILLTLPICGVRVIYVAINFIGMLIIAHLGSMQLAAGALITSASTTLITIAMSPLLAISMIASRYMGQSRFSDMGSLLRQSFLISAVIGIIVCVILWYLPAILLHLKEPPQLIPFLSGYFHGMIPGIIPFLITACCFQFYFSARSINLIVLWSTVTLTITLVLGWMMIHGYGPISAIGISGWAYANSIANWVVMIGIFLNFYWNKKLQSYALFNIKNYVNWSELKNLLKMGWPIAIQFSGELGAFAILNIMVGWLGPLELSVQQIVLQCSVLALMLPMSGAQSSSVLISQSIGSGEKNEVRKICWSAIIFILAVMVLISALYLFFPRLIIDMYVDHFSSDNQRIIDLAVLIFTVAAFSQSADAIRNVVIGALRGLHDSKGPMWINTVLLFLVALPLSYFLSFKLKLGLLGLNLGFLISFFFGAVAMFWRFLEKTKTFTLPHTSFTELQKS